MRFQTIYADPPWYEQGAGKICRGANRHYALMKTPAIAALPIAPICAENAHLYLWVTNNHLHDGLRVCEAWGFRYITLITWAKHRIGIGQYFRGMTEHCIFGVRGRLPYRFRADGKRAQGRTLISAPRTVHSRKLEELRSAIESVSHGRTLISAPRTVHSRKPEELRSAIESVSHGPYLEIFATQQHAGWRSIGNMISGRDVKDELIHLSTQQDKPEMRQTRAGNALAGVSSDLDSTSPVCPAECLRGKEPAQGAGQSPVRRAAKRSGEVAGTV